MIKTSQMLAREMARHARTVRELVEEVYALEARDDPLHRLYGSFKELLLHDLTPDAFADMVAQTVAYGLFSAAAQTDDLSYDRMVELIPKTNPFLRDLLAELTADDAMDVEELGVGQLVNLLNQTDMEAILHDFGKQSGWGREDPVVHFYELFLAEYDKEQKVQRGVFYTPDPVVSYIVRSVDHLLRAEFGLEDGLADTTVDPETGEPLVQILDPACGTGTFLAHVIDQIEATVKARGPRHFGCADWSEYVAEHLLPRLNGFELMMAPYAVAHMKLGLKLRQTGYDFRSGERLRVFLTNTLEEPVEAHETLALTGFLSKESNAAARVKRQRPITVVIGNPPYSGHTANQSEWIAALLHGRDSQGRAVPSYFEVDGQPLRERNTKWLHDDYVKFIRFGQWRLRDDRVGILAIISNHGYIDNPTFRGMRQSLMDSFAHIYILDLHGNVRKKEIPPDDVVDENVFDIQQGVCIGIFLNPRERGGTHRKIHHADLWGSRDTKYSRLQEGAISSVCWQSVTPVKPLYMLVPQDLELEEEYREGWSATSLFPINVVGLFTARDSLTIHDSPQAVWQTVRDFAALPPERARDKYQLPKDVRDWKVHLAQRDLRDSGPELANVIPISYRPFDVRFTYYTGHSKGFHCMPRGEVMSNMIGGSNIGLVVNRQTVDDGIRHVWLTRHVLDLHIIQTAHASAYLLPLYLYPSRDHSRLLDDSRISAWKPSNSHGERVPNLAPNHVRTLAQSLSLRFISDGLGDLKDSFGPEDLFHYSYSVLHSPTYRSRYAEFMKTDFPYLPRISNHELFAKLCMLGADLVALHLLEDDYPAASWVRQPGESPLQHPITTFVARGTGTTMGAFSKSTCYGKGHVYLDTSQRSRSSYFDGVPEDVWNFQIGGYQVLHKWLYDRRGVRGQPGRTLTEEDIAHYQRIVVALKETIRLMEEIDEVIEQHGGWPIE